MDLLSNTVDLFPLLKETEKYKLYSRKTESTYDGEHELYNSEDIFVFDDLIVAKKSEKTIRRYRASGKTGYYFKSVYEKFYSARNHTRDGSPMFRVMNMHGDFTFQTNHHNSNPFDNAVAKHVVEMVTRKYGIEVEQESIDSIDLYKTIAYPMYKQWKIGKEDKIEILHYDVHSFRALSRGFLRSNPRDFVEQTFGKKFLRKDFIKQVAKTEDLARLAALARCRKYFSSDLGLTFLREENRMGLDAVSSKRDLELLGLLLAPLNNHQRRRIIMAKVGLYKSYEVLDSLNSLDRLQNIGGYDPSRIDFKNWGTIHDTLSAAVREQQNQASNKTICDLEEKMITQKNYYTKLDNVSIIIDDETYTIQSAKNLGDLVRWGNIMHNCIGSYSKAATSHQSYLFGLYKNDTLLANIEMNNKGQVVQLYGKYNRMLDFNIDNAVKKYIGKAVQ